ncbi:HD domain-containing phosphohydrolase [Marinobacter litoralis]|uniref:HD domain-containing phosphohydrolase n=1 Tax=Marinobacter litoralis TaxID=187981 RepID=UPI0018ECF60E|nr:HD domain-containing phosphohydrolase [Marinobacter litoralis]MBJ6138911.1 hypothetical protein [Marinobacter litoralis]
MKNHLCIISSDSSLINLISKAFKPIGIEIDPVSPSIFIDGELERAAIVTLVDLESFDHLPHQVWERLRKSLDHTFYVSLLARAHNTVHRKWFGNPVKTLSKPLTGAQLRWLACQCVERLRSQNMRSTRTPQLCLSKPTDAVTLQAILKHQHPEKAANQERVVSLVDFISERCKIDPSIGQAISISSRFYDLGVLLEISEGGSQLRLVQKRRRAFHSAALAKLTGASNNVLRILRNLDENWDGSGSPHGKKGKEIPIGARILRIAIDFVRLQYDNEQGLFLSTNECAAWLRDAAGHFYDPELVNRFVDHLMAGKTEPPTNAFWILGARNLRSGMTLSEDLYGRAGLMLLSKGKVLNQNLVSRLIDYEERFCMRDGLFAGIFESQREDINNKFTQIRGIPSQSAVATERISASGNK